MLAYPKQVEAGRSRLVPLFVAGVQPIAHMKASMVVCFQIVQTSFIDTYLGPSLKKTIGGRSLVANTTS